jgi:hypothetical protein
LDNNVLTIIRTYNTNIRTIQYNIIHTNVHTSIITKMKLLFDTLAFVEKHLPKNSNIRFAKTCKRFGNIWKSHKHNDLIHIRGPSGGGCNYAALENAIKSDHYKYYSIFISKIILIPNTNFSKLHSLTLFACAIPDPSILKHLNTLYISHCTIHDVSDLANVHKLTLTGCDNMVNMACLNTVHTLTITNCDNIDISKIGSGTVHDLTIAYSVIEDVSFLKSVHTLTLYLCKKLENVSELGQVHKLTLDGCIAIQDVSKLGTVHDLTIKNCPEIKDVAALNTVHKLTLQNVTAAASVSISKLGNVHDLTLTNCPYIRNVSNLSTVHDLTIKNCPNVKYVSKLGKVPKLFIEKCDHLKHLNIKKLNTVRKLKIQDCYHIKDTNRNY